MAGGWAIDFERFTVVEDGSPDTGAERNHQKAPFELFNLLNVVGGGDGVRKYFHNRWKGAEGLLHKRVECGTHEAGNVDGKGDFALGAVVQARETEPKAIDLERWC